MSDRTITQDVSSNGTGAVQTHHINVCICTFKRAELLTRVLPRLINQKSNGLFSYSIIVADNDEGRSAERVVADFSSRSSLQVIYCVEPQQNIALARNKALQQADGDFVAFIDDDEFPADDWLLNLLNTCLACEADGVLGPVKPAFASEPPAWIRKGRFFEKRTAYPTGHKLPWPDTRTGNVLFRRKILNDVETPFRSKFGTAGEDVDFFRRMMEKGCTFVWCDEAVVYEVIPQSRCTRRYLLRRALLRGSNFPKHPKHRVRNIAKSLVAVPCYSLALPALLIVGQHVFMTYLEKMLDHAARLLAFVGLPLVNERP